MRERGRKGWRKGGRDGEMEGRWEGEREREREREYMCACVCVFGGSTSSHYITFTIKETYLIWVSFASHKDKVLQRVR